MTKYKLIIGQESIEFLTISEAETFAVQRGIANPAIEEVVEVVNESEVYSIRLEKDKVFGKSLIDLFLLDNRLMPFAIAVSDSLNVLTKFSAVESLARNADIKSIQAILPSIEIDAIFTQERKDKYIAMVNTHLLYL